MAAIFRDFWKKFFHFSPFQDPNPLKRPIIIESFEYRMPGIEIANFLE
jgi:hypothetical protein